MGKIEVSPVNNEKRSESSGGNYDIWRKAMDKVHGDAGVKPPTINRPYCQQVNLRNRLSAKKLVE